jgi:two-component system, cell cycle sensor histidine kinase and response regulator CckA
MEDKLIGVMAVFSRESLSTAWHTGLLAVANSIAIGIERKQLDQEAAANLEETRSILDSIADAFTTLDGDWRYTFANDTALAMFRRTREELLGKCIWEVFPELTGTRFQAEMQRLAVEKQGHFEEFFEPCGIWLENHLYPKRDGLTMLSRDVTQRRQFDEKMRQTAKLESLGVLAGGVAHDFNNLLTGILGNASLAIEMLSPSSPARAILGDLVSASERAAKLTKQLLAYAGKGRFVIEMLDLSATVKEISHLVQLTIPKSAQIQLDLAPELPLIEADAAQIQQLVMNLVINGAEAIPEGTTGNVLVTTRSQHVDESYIGQTFSSSEIQPGDYVTIEVHDTGSGMDQATVARIFDPFFTTKFTGRGLGLSAALGIVRGHKGALKVYSATGKGSTFKVLFPAAATSASMPARTEPRVANLGKCGTTVLVIDDEITVRKIAKTALLHYGFDVILAEGGEHGVEEFRVNPVDVVLLDLTMPGIGGEDVLRLLRAIRQDVRVILSSGFNEVEVIQRFTGKGLAGFLQKPYNAASLVSKVREVMQREAVALEAPDL